jgi:hypothetical protein
MVRNSAAGRESHLSATDPPKLATFLMERLAGCGPILLGDLQEEYCGGRSRMWYWREALHVVAWSLVVGVRRHPIKFLRAIAAFVIANNLAGLAVGALALEFVKDTPGWIYSRHQVYTLVWIALAFPIFATATWCMAKLHPEVRVPATLVVAGLMILNIVLKDVELQRLWQNMPEPRFIPYFLRHVLGSFVWITAVVVGGTLVPVQSRGLARRSS